MSTRKRIWAALVAAMLTTFTVVVVNVIPAQADPPLTNCLTQLVTCGYPTLQSAGADDLGSYTPVSDEEYDTTADNQVIEDIELTGCIIVHHDNVTISNVIIHAEGCFYGIEFLTGTSSSLVVHTDVDCTNGLNTGISFEGDDGAADAVWVHGCENAITLTNDVTVTDSVLMGYEGNTVESHGDLIQFFGPISDIVIDGNLLLGTNPMTSAIGYDQDTGATNVDWINNFAMAGAFTFYCPWDNVSDMTISGNRLWPMAEEDERSGSGWLADAHAPSFGYTSSCDTSGITWSGNILDTGATVNSDGSVS